MIQQNPYAFGPATTVIVQKPKTLVPKQPKKAKTTRKARSI